MLAQEEARRLEHNYIGTGHLLLAALDDASSAVIRALETIGIDLDRARIALRDVDVTGTSDESPDPETR